MHPLLLHNGRIHLQAQSPQAEEALLLRGERVEVAGALYELEAATDRGARRIDLNGGVVFPGFIDAHIHLEQFALKLSQVDCEQPTMDACLELLAERAADTPEGAWVLGYGWNQNVWGRFGNRNDLDGVIPDQPVYLKARSGHAAWVNSRALQLARIGADTPEPEGGAIQRDPDGAPTGVLFEAAMQLVSDLIPQISEAELADYLAGAQMELLKLGLTGVHDFDGAACLKALQILRERGGLKLRILKNIPVEYLEEARRIGLRSGFGDDWIRLGNVKVFADGALGPRTAAMLQPYLNDGDNRGMLLVEREALTEIFNAASEAGLGMTVHAIGDRANHEVLEAYKLLRETELGSGRPRLRHRVEHLQLVHPDDIGRAGELDLIASMQPIHAVSDMLVADQYWGERVATAYAWRAQLDSGARLAFGSDAPFDSPNPFWGLHAAVTRRRADGSPGNEGWITHQRINLGEALAAYTMGPAFAAGMEATQGKLLPGYLADLVVLESDPFEVDDDELLEMRPLGTMVNGQWQHREF